MKTFDGLLDRVSFPEAISGFIVAPEPDPRIHGYAVQGDLGHHTGFVDVLWLSLTGELPSALEREPLERALIWLAPLHAGEGPTHAAILSKVAGAPEEVVPAIAAVALGQRVAAEWRDLNSFFQWLTTRDATVPETVLEPEPTQAQREAWQKLCADTARWFGVERAFSGAPWKREATAYALLHRLGISDFPRLCALASIARLPVILAEAACTAPGSVMRYPTKMPPYVYVEGDVP